MGSEYWMKSAGASSDSVCRGVGVGDGVGRGVIAVVGAVGEDPPEPHTCEIVPSRSTAALAQDPPL